MWKFRHVILRMIYHQEWIRYPSEISKYRKDLWEDQKSIKERLDIIFQNGILEHGDWEEWVWLVAFVRIYMSFTK